MLKMQTEILPAINVINPTPPRPGGQFRLLYRGALSLPDSHLLLDGLTFVARLEHPSSGGHNLLENPLALALESMRKRPSLRWMGPTKLASIYMDETGGISMDIHPNATLTRIYFENTFCLDPSHDFGIKVALGDSDGSDTTQMIIFARPQATGELQLIVARITPAPPPPSLLRLPRPDDPTPRRPPIRFDRSSSVGSNPLVRKRTASMANLGSSVRLDSASFKVPDVPRSSVKREEDLDDDVFGQVENKGKRKATESEAENQMEKANKTIIKQSAMHLLPIPKTHPEYKDVYGTVYRGVLFALRGEVKRSAVDLKSVERLVKIHVNMYVPSEARKNKS
ncbi:hypothetical protein C8F04DRAFT_1002868 [Mycena alexandri]|uniref:Sld7 C-terminal domain-containing protein n=1 Tax=Mycena alexandri TaxID=1745969 RepID=A0AAD6X5Z5_9AGAR|nr:hypothetical protein C8F04DRAFT_1002868 [Mycena alexandri]